MRDKIVRKYSLYAFVQLLHLLIMHVQQLSFVIFDFDISDWNLIPYMQFKINQPRKIKIRNQNTHQINMIIDRVEMEIDWYVFSQKQFEDQTQSFFTQHTDQFSINHYLQILQFRIHTSIQHTGMIICRQLYKHYNKNNELIGMLAKLRIIYSNLPKVIMNSAQKKEFICAMLIVIWFWFNQKKVLPQIVHLFSQIDSIIMKSQLISMLKKLYSHFQLQWFLKDFSIINSQLKIFIKDTLCEFFHCKEKQLTDKVYKNISAFQFNKIVQFFSNYQSSIPIFTVSLTRYLNSSFNIKPLQIINFHQQIQPFLKPTYLIHPYSMSLKGFLNNPFIKQALYKLFFTIQTSLRKKIIKYFFTEIDSQYQVQKQIQGYYLKRVISGLTWNNKQQNQIMEYYSIKMPLKHHNKIHHILKLQPNSLLILHKDLIFPQWSNPISYQIQSLQVIQEAQKKIKDLNDTRKHFWLISLAYVEILFDGILYAVAGDQIPLILQYARGQHHPNQYEKSLTIKYFENKNKRPKQSPINTYDIFYKVKKQLQQKNQQEISKISVQALIVRLMKRYKTKEQQDLIKQLLEKLVIKREILMNYISGLIEKGYLHMINDKLQYVI